MATTPSHALISAAQALATVEQSGEERSALLFSHGSARFKLYAPRGTDSQMPHLQDEIYVVLRGSGTFWNGETRSAFGPGDLLFAAAGRPHRFEDFTGDFATWVIFYGPEGGEAGAS